MGRKEKWRTEVVKSPLYTIADTIADTIATLFANKSITPGCIRLAFVPSTPLPKRDSLHYMEILLLGIVAKSRFLPACIASLLLLLLSITNGNHHISKRKLRAFYVPQVGLLLHCETSPHQRPWAASSVVACHLPCAKHQSSWMAIQLESA